MRSKLTMLFFLVILMGGLVYYESISSHQAVNMNPSLAVATTQQSSTSHLYTDWSQQYSSQQYAAMTDADWEKILTASQYNILREKGTEVPFSSPLDTETRPGTYITADCHEPVFRSEQKYDSGTGWPSFWAPINPAAVVLQPDNSIFPTRTEVLSKCGGHLGHIFQDGPPPTGLRYCMNGAALIFIPDQQNSTQEKKSQQ